MELRLKSYLLSIGLFLSFVSQGQTEGSAFTLTGMGVSTPFARDYQCVGINPANLDIEPRYKKSVTIGMMELGASLYSESLKKEEVRANLFGEKIDKFTPEEQRQYAKEFALSKNTLDFEATAFGIAVRTNKLGTFSFKINDRFNMFYELGPTASDIVWLGYGSSYFDSLVVNNNGVYDTIPNSANLNIDSLTNVVSGVTSAQNAENLTEILQGTQFKMSWVREFNFAYGKRLFSNDNWEIHGGVGIKFLLGQGMLFIDARDGNAEVYSSLSPVFNVDYTKIAGQNPSLLPTDARPLKPVGFGFGVDLGTTIVFKKNLFFSAAINDIGSMTWDGNLYTLKDTKLLSFENPGVESTDFINQFNTLNGSDALLEWQGSGSFQTKLPTTMRLGIGHEKFQKFKVGVDFVAPLNNDVASISKPVIALGGEYSPIKHVHLQAGYVQGGNYDTKIPVGIYFTLGQEGGYEFGFASRDIVTFFSEQQPTVSMVFGFLRFRF